MITFSYSLVLGFVLLLHPRTIYGRPGVAPYNEVREFDVDQVRCKEPGYHTQYYDDLVNTFSMAVNVLHELEMDFVVIQGTLLSILRNQPIFAYDHDVDIYVVINDGNPKHEKSRFIKSIKNAVRNYESTADEQYIVNQDLSHMLRINKGQFVDGASFRTGWTDIYFITLENGKYYGGDTGKDPLDASLLFPVQFVDWIPHWNETFDGEKLKKRNSIPIPHKPHEWAEIVFHDHMRPDQYSLTCDALSEYDDGMKMMKYEPVAIADCERVYIIKNESYLYLFGICCLLVIAVIAIRMCLKRKRVRRQRLVDDELPELGELVLL